MSNTISPNMLLPIPTVGSEAGPTYAFDINSALTLIDQHDHSPGKGVQLTAASITINAAFSMNGNFLTNAAGVTFTPQISTPAVGTIYETGVDLYYVDGVGNNVRITQSGALAGTPGSIANLVPPASATYVAGSKTFVWQSGTSIAANMDFAAATFRNISPNSTFGVTVQPPAALGSNWTLTLPPIPGSNSFLTIDTSGNITGSITQNHGITSANIGLATILTTNIAANTILGANIALNTIQTQNVQNNQLPYSVATKSTAYTALVSDGMILANTTSAGFTITLFTAIGNTGQILQIKKTSNDLNTLLISPTGGQAIDGNTNTSLNTQGEELTIMSDGSNWQIVNRRIPSAWQLATFGVSGGFGGISAQGSYIKRVGDSLMCKVYIQLSSTSAATGKITLPTGIQIDTTKIGNANTHLGTWSGLRLSNAFVNSPGRIGIVSATTGDAGSVYLSESGTGAGGFDSITVNSFVAGGDAVTLDFVIPISGWFG